MNNHNRLRKPLLRVLSPETLCEQHREWLGCELLHHVVGQGCRMSNDRGELSYLAPLSSENISAPYFKQCFFQGGELPPRQSNNTRPSPKTEITNILFYILNFASIINLKCNFSLTFYHNKKQK